MDLALQGSWVVDDLTHEHCSHPWHRRIKSSLVLSSLRLCVLVQWLKCKGLEWQALK